MNNQLIQIFTIGFTGKCAEEFFQKIKTSGAQKVIDTRLWASSQLSGFARKKDLPFFFKELCEIPYEYRKDLAPTSEILKAFKGKKIGWEEYEAEYKKLIQSRNVSNILKPQELDKACLLCACKTEHQCHRRILAEHLKDEWQNVEIKHL